MTEDKKPNPLERLAEALTPKTDSEKMRSAILEQIQVLADAWPDMLAAWNGMLRQTMADGWEEMAARGMVLTAIVSNPMYFAVNAKDEEDNQ